MVSVFFYDPQRSDLAWYGSSEELRKERVYTLEALIRDCEYALGDPTMEIDQLVTVQTLSVIDYILATEGHEIDWLGGNPHEDFLNYVVMRCKSKLEDLNG